MKHFIFSLLKVGVYLPTSLKAHIEHMSNAVVKCAGWMCEAHIEFCNKKCMSNVMVNYMGQMCEVHPPISTKFPLKTLGGTPRKGFSPLVKLNF